MTAVVVGETTWRHAAAGESGMLLVRGPNVFGGYLGRDEQPFISFEGEMWYRTGDLVSRDTDGCLTFRGRLRRFIKIGGEMISLPQIETVLSAAFTPAADDGDTPEKSAGDGPLLAVESTPENFGQAPRIVLFTTIEISREAANAACERPGSPGCSLFPARNGCRPFLSWGRARLIIERLRHDFLKAELLLFCAPCIRRIT